MSTQTGTSAEDAVRSWFKLHNPQLDVQAIDLDHDLIENRILDSLQFMEFLIFIEDVSGREIRLEEISLDQFRTLRAIRDNLLVDATADLGEEVVF